MSKPVRIWLQVLCLLLLGQWWHAVAMPYETHAHEHRTAPHPVAQAHDAAQVDTVTEASSSCCDAPTSSQSSCSNAHLCCSVQATPWMTEPAWQTADAGGTRHARVPQLVLQPRSDRLFKPPKATLLL